MAGAAIPVEPQPAEPQPVEPQEEPQLLQLSQVSQQPLLNLPRSLLKSPPPQLSHESQLEPQPHESQQLPRLNMPRSLSRKLGLPHESQQSQEEAQVVQAGAAHVSQLSQQLRLNMPRSLSRRLGLPHESQQVSQPPPQHEELTAGALCDTGTMGATCAPAPVIQAVVTSKNAAFTS